MKPGCIIKLVVRAIDVITLLLPVILIMSYSLAAESGSGPVLTHAQWMALEMAVNEAEIAATEDVGGRHAIIVMLLEQWGIPVASSASWQIVRFAQRLLERGWKQGTNEPGG